MELFSIYFHYKIRVWENKSVDMTLNFLQIQIQIVWLLITKS